MQLSDKWRKALTETLRRLQATRRCTSAAAGYNPKQILEQLLLIAKADSRCASRNLSLQLRGALKRAVGEGLLKLRAGRYILAVPNKRPVAKKEARNQQQRHTTNVNDSLPIKSHKSTSSNRKKATTTTTTVKKRVKIKKSSRSKR